jgi:hypothetical protein
VIAIAMRGPAGADIASSGKAESAADAFNREIAIPSADVSAREARPEDLGRAGFSDGEGR